MHIALVTPSWPMHRYPNGIVTYVHLLREELRAQGHRISVFANRIAPDGHEPGVHLVSDSMGSRLARRLARWAGNDLPEVFGWGQRIAASIDEVHRADPVDVIEMEESFGWCGDVQRLVDIPLVVKLHGPAFLSLVEEELDTPLAQQKIAAEGRALRRLHTITSPSGDTLRRTLERYGLRPALSEVVPNPMQVSTEVGLWDAARAAPRHILFVGRFDKRKGGDLVLLAFRRLLETDPRLRLTFVGPDTGLVRPAGPRIHFDEFCAGHFDPSQRERIDYKGQLSQADIARLRTQASVTLVASRWDNQPNTALEAMIQACPVVAVQAGGVDELVEHGVTGLLARAGDHDDLCAQLLAALDDPAAAGRMGQAARRRVLERHAGRTLAEQSLAVYRRAIAQHVQEAATP
ncbi:glycosyltransferase family 4 protein [Piscinibacter sp. XHJ-5]|uniref:glycosyltransferase family 4 protein n=1 Tax=Piscinibacter sp. XHJ-5 TaxID=3037797 RepID=UPI0024533764|nr:glycosyltransferase family 4 protein [Piscinibacter sp. XHJ-5]